MAEEDLALAPLFFEAQVREVWRGRVDLDCLPETVTVGETVTCSQRVTSSEGVASGVRMHRGPGAGWTLRIAD